MTIVNSNDILVFSRWCYFHCLHCSLSLVCSPGQWVGVERSDESRPRPLDDPLTRRSGERTVRCINQVVPRCHTCWRATLNLTTFKTSSMAPQGFHWPSSEPYCPFCPSLPPNSFDAGLFLLEIKPHDWWLGSMPVGKSLQITFEMSPNIWNG